VRIHATGDQPWRQYCRIVKEIFMDAALPKGLPAAQRRSLSCSNGQCPDKLSCDRRHCGEHFLTDGTQAKSLGRRKAPPSIIATVLYSTVEATTSA
jgi:hypothetical protein